MTKYEKFYYYLEVNQSAYLSSRIISVYQKPWLFLPCQEGWALQSNAFGQKVIVSDRLLLKLWKVL